MSRTLRIEPSISFTAPEMTTTLTNEGELKRQVIEDERRLKDEYFSKYPDSPVSSHERNSFHGLNYYPVDSKFRFKVQLQKYDKPAHVSLMTSTGTNKEFIRFGFFEFSIDGRTYRVQVYKPAHSHGGEESLFIPFRDGTSGVETYGAGRYIDIPENERGIYELDFNKAYNPYCAYSQEYVCPVPPRENWLDTEIRAGERAYKEP